MTIFRATAHTNIALIKYWGKSALEGNLPATGSLSLTLDRFYTTTSVQFVDGSEDIFTLNNAPADLQSQQRVFAFVDLVRQLSGENKRVSIQSSNFVPTSSGLASSASGFAALTLALSKAFGLPNDKKALSVLARQGSGSAARSIFGGFALMHGGAGVSGEEAYVEAITASPSLDAKMIVLECARAPKAISSREAMRLTAQSSIFYQSFLDNHPRLLSAALLATQAGELSQLGALMEQSTMQMHATMLGCEKPFWYFNATTVAVLDEVRRLRASGVDAYFTMDAGPHVKVLCQASDAEKLAKSFGQIDGVSNITVCGPGPEAYLHE